MHNILVTGSKGQLGNEIQKLATSYPFCKFIFTDVEELDITDVEQIDNFFNKNKIDFIINCAAYTAVDKAETDRKLADLINVTAVKYLAKISKKFKTILIHISTDYIFNGKNYKPYVETDKPVPSSYYGQTKLNGEIQIEKYAGNAIIIRTSWLYSGFGNNFVKTMIKYGNERDSLKVVADQVGTPTYAADLAKAILEIIPKLINIKGIEIYNFSNEGAISWYDFAKAIMKLKNINCKIIPIESKDYPTLAPRPFYSILNKAKIKNDFGIEIPYWLHSLEKCLAELK
ncbi:MAG: dTDP-4-dehydrorhamnose reductase [Bacteroidales bacterium]|nr:dTDP-4-dehydrorhamnose reductase [Bacteroidales bacterium]